MLITVPLYGTLVRFRANYTPKGLALDGEGGVQPHVGPVVTSCVHRSSALYRSSQLSKYRSYFQMMFRVKRIEVRTALSVLLNVHQA